MAPVGVDMVYRLFEIVNNANRDDQIQVFRLPVCFCRLARTGNERPRSFVAAHLHAVILHRFDDSRQGTLGNVTVNKQGLDRVGETAVGVRKIGREDNIRIADVLEYVTRYGFVRLD